MSKQDIEKRLGFAAQGVKSEFGSNDPYMQERTVKTRKGKTTDLVAEIGQNGGGGDYIATLMIVHSNGEPQVLQSKYGYKTPESATRAAIRLFDAHVSRGGYARSGVKAKMAKRMIVDTITSGNQKHELGYESVMQPVAAGEPPHEWFRPIVRTTNLDTGKSSEKASQPHYTEKSAREWLKNYASSVKPSTDPLYAEYASNREKISKMMTRLAQARNNPELRQKLQAESDKLDARQREVAAQLQKRKSSRTGVKAEMAIGSYKQGDRTVTVNGKKYEVLPYQMDFFIKELATLDTPEWRADVVKEYLRRGYIKATAARPGAKAEMGFLSRVGYAATALTADPADPKSPEYRKQVSEAKAAAKDAITNYKFMRDKVKERLAALDAYVTNAIKVINSATSAKDIEHYVEQLRIAVKSQSMILGASKSPFSRPGAKAEFGFGPAATSYGERDQASIQGRIYGAIWRIGNRNDNIREAKANIRKLTAEINNTRDIKRKAKLSLLLDSENGVIKESIATIKKSQQEIKEFQNRAKSLGMTLDAQYLGTFSRPGAKAKMSATFIVAEAIFNAENAVRRGDNENARRWIKAAQDAMDETVVSTGMRSKLEQLVKRYKMSRPGVKAKA